MTTDPLTDRVVAFLDDIGLPVVEGAVPAGSVLPGVALRSGGLVLDRGAAGYQPGDLLHEAGHLAVLPPAERSAADGRLTGTPADEMAAMAWSWAAAAHLGLPAEVVFHEDGYKGDGPALAAAFAGGGGPGIPLLQWYGMVEEWPRLRCWLRP